MYPICIQNFLAKDFFLLCLFVQFCVYCMYILKCNYKPMENFHTLSQSKKDFFLDSAHNELMLKIVLSSFLIIFVHFSIFPLSISHKFSIGLVNKKINFHELSVVSFKKMTNFNCFTDCVRNDQYGQYYEGKKW